MINIALILEGAGDIAAVPNLAVRSAALAGEQVLVPHPIRAGGYVRLKQAGQIERFVTMAVRREGIDAVVIVLDLDDGCPVAEIEAVQERCAAVSMGVPVRICFCIREYECWLLQDVENLRREAPDINWDPEFACDAPEKRRGAKELLQAAMRQSYKETVDQLGLTRRLDIKNVYSKDRSFRRFVRAVTGQPYATLDGQFRT